MNEKPAKGSAAKMARARRRLIEVRERAAKDAAKARDHWTCRRCHRSTLYMAETEAAHIRDKGMGGDHGRLSSTAADYVTLCATCHRGPRSIHSGHVRIIAGPDGGDGPVRFENVAQPGVSRGGGR